MPLNGPLSSLFAYHPRPSILSQVRGLGGSNTIDYSEDERRPALGFCDEDYIRFMGQRIDATFINAAKADVTVCGALRVCVLRCAGL